MAYVKIEIESGMGDTKFYSPPVVDDRTITDNPTDYEKKVLRELLVGMVQRIYAAYDIPVTVISDAGADNDPEKLGKAILAVVQSWGIDPIQPRELGEKVLMFMKDPSAFPMAGRPIKDSPQA